MQIRSIPQQRIIEKMDDYMSRRDYAGAERHLLYWLEEAVQGQDLRGQLLIRNELIGHYRKTADREHALENIEKALHLLAQMDFGDSISAGTTFVNAATACSAFEENERAMELFEKARQIYEADSSTEPQLLGGLYNNMALTCVSVAKERIERAANAKSGEGAANAESGEGAADAENGGEESRDWFRRAFALYDKALGQMRQVPNGELEQAITWLNMADALEGRDGPEAAEHQITELLDRAYDLLQTPSVPRDGYYAFVCEKCAPTFSYYGYFLAAEELQKQAETIYMKNSNQTDRSI